ncbi:MAG: helix-turn-helix domain-containing protein [Oscillospiraceae bacterium]|nr:helix-turn-helix domain-containing protein [Oscillospiraceae bacterium]
MEKGLNEKMNGEILGRKLKEARLLKKMTQSEVVGNYITRNMLSQIESGAAFPSIRTLEYLSDVLEVSMPELLADTADGVNNDGNTLNGTQRSAARETIVCPHCGIKFEKGQN